MLLLIIAGTTALWAQKTITGTVTDEGDGSTIPGISILEKGTSNGTITDIDGKYSLTVQGEKSVIVFSFMGMKSQEIIVGNQTKINPKMKSMAIKMDDIVVTALGIKKEEKALGYAVQQISGNDAIEAGNPNPIAGLQGKVSGVQVIQSSGTPGASAKILIRGNATFGNSQPLIVIDGIPIDNNTNTTYESNVDGVDQSNRAIDINPEDIASVTVLKGAAATALYGSRAGNGVIVYTTKSGSNTGGKLFGTYSSSINISSPVNLHEQQQKYGQSSGAYSWGDEVSGDEIYDNLGEFFRTGVSQEHNLSLYGGTEKTQIRASVGHSNSQGIIPNSYWKRTSARVTASSQLNDRLAFRSSINVLNSGGNRPQKGSNLAGTMLSLYRAPISFNLKEAYDNSNEGNENYFQYYDNPYYTAKENTYIDDVWRIMGYGSLTLDLRKKDNPYLNDFKLMYRSGIDTYSDNRKGQSPIGSNATDDGRGKIIDYKSVFYEWNNDLLLTGSKSAEKWSMNFTFGTNSRTLQDNYSLATGYELNEPDFYNLLNAQSVVTEQYTEIINEYAAFGDVTFGWDRTVYLGITGRNEWSSVYDLGKNNHFFPGVNLAFIVSELFEDGKIGPLTFAKLRGSSGKTGIAPDAWRYRSYTEPVSVRDGYTDGNSTDANGAQLTNWIEEWGNPDLKPEILTGNEIGLDLRFWEGRLTFDMAYYHQVTSDVLIYVPTPSSTGRNYQYQNIGELVNKGFEISVGSDVIKNKNFKWNTNFNFGKNVNEVTKLADGLEEVSLGGGFTSISAYARVGDPLGVMYGDNWERDANDNVLIDDEGYAILNSDNKKVGDPYPDFTLGWRNTFSYKDFTLSFFFDGFFGGDIYNGTRSMMNFRGIGIDTEDREGTEIIEGIRKSDGQVNTIAISKQDYWQYYKGIAGASEEFVENVNYVKLRNVSFSYHLELDKKLFKFFNDFTFTVVGSNLYTFTNYSTGDPETSLTGAGSPTQGFDYFNSPNVRGFMFKIATKF